METSFQISVVHGMMKKAKRAGGFSADISHGNVEAILKPVALPRNRLNRPWHEVRVGAAGGYWPSPRRIVGA